MQVPLSHHPTSLAPLGGEGKSSEPSETVITVDWDGEHDPEHPRKYVQNTVWTLHFSYLWNSWTYRNKWVATGIISTYTMLSPITSSMIAPASAQVAEDLNAHGQVFQPLLTSIFILAYGALRSSSRDIQFC